MELHCWADRTVTTVKEIEYGLSSLQALLDEWKTNYNDFIAVYYGFSNAWPGMAQYIYEFESIPDGYWCGLEPLIIDFEYDDEFEVWEDAEDWDE